jgi:hypothetical protein
MAYVFHFICFAIRSCASAQAQAWLAYGYGISHTVCRFPCWHTAQVTMLYAICHVHIRCVIFRPIHCGVFWLTFVLWHICSCMLWHIRAYILALLCHDSFDMHYVAFLLWHICCCILWHIASCFLWHFCSGIFAAFTLTISYYHASSVFALAYSCLIARECSGIFVILWHITEYLWLLWHNNSDMHYVACLLWHVRCCILWHIPCLRFTV